jgi:Flp pilus assembly protein TadG
MRERGQSIVEFALVLPLLLIVLLGLLDLGRVYYTLVALEDMASEGATYAAIHPDAEHEEEVCARAAYGSTGMVVVDPTAVRVEYPPEIAPGASVTVTVPYSFTFVTPIVGAMVEDSMIELRGTAVSSIISDQ